MARHGGGAPQTPDAPVDPDTTAALCTLSPGARRELVVRSGLLLDLESAADIADLPAVWLNIRNELFRGERGRAGRLARRVAQVLAAQQDLAGALACVLWGVALLMAGDETPPSYLAGAHGPPATPRDQPGLAPPTAVARQNDRAAPA